MEVPAALAREWAEEAEWLAALPRLAAECAAQWGLGRLGDPFPSPRSLVVPAGEAVLKLNAPGHVEADHEADALVLWAGGGAVRLLARDDARRALLVERCLPGTPLTEAPGEQLAAVAELLPRLWVAPPSGHPFRLLADEAARWAEEVPARWAAGGRPFERRLLDEALETFGTVDRRAERLVNQDLHGGNVLRASRAPWLAIDPKPLVGEPELDGVGLLRNAALDARAGAPSPRSWLDALAALGLDRSRLRAWGSAHALAWGWEPRSGWSERAVAAARAIAAA